MVQSLTHSVNVCQVFIHAKPYRRSRGHNTESTWRQPGPHTAHVSVEGEKTTEWDGGDGAILDRMVREGPTEKATFDQTLQGAREQDKLRI